MDVGVFVEFGAGGVVLAEADEELAEDVVGGRMDRFKTDAVVEGFDGLLRPANAPVCEGELVVGGGDAGMESLALLERLDGVFVLAEAVVGAADQVVGGGEVALEGHRLMGMVDGACGLIGQQQCAGKVKAGVWLGGVEVDGGLEGGCSAGGVAAVELALADVHQGEKAFGGGGRSGSGGWCGGWGERHD